MTIQRRTALLFLALIPALLCSPGCGRRMYNPSMATQPYPYDLHTTQTLDMQVFRDDTTITIVNSTPHSFADFDLWLNQRYVHHVESLGAGETITLSLWDFFDANGDRFNAGGFFRAYAATPVRLVQIQAAPDQRLAGLITIRREDVIVPAEPGR